MELSAGPGALPTSHGPASPGGPRKLSSFQHQLQVFQGRTNTVFNGPRERRCHVSRRTLRFGPSWEKGFTQPRPAGDAILG
jgi:hypothetical protein